MSHTRPLPTRLRSEPLVDAIFEMHFSAQSADQVLPGLLFPRLDGEKRMEKLPISDIPEVIRRNNQNLAAQPLRRLFWDRYILSFGESMFGVACQLPYPGWSAFRKQIIFLTGLVADTGIIERVSRFDLRYVDLIDGQGPADLGPKLDASLVLGGMQLTDYPLHMQAIVKQGGMPHHVTLTFPVELAVGDARARRRGMLLAVSTRSEVACLGVEFLAKLQNMLNAVHQANKETFFACLSDDAIQAMGPETC